MNAIAKRGLDIAVSLVALAILAPLLALVAALVWLGDLGSPIYAGRRVERGDHEAAPREFRMIKFRTMSVDAWKAGVNSTAAGDRRITRIGRFLRRFKLDELPQFLNVLGGQMSLVGPRPQVRADAALYTEEERRMLSIRPGITDLASIVFADEGEILAGARDPDLAYNQIIRPWKSRLALIYVEHASLGLDLRILLLTAVALVSRRRALAAIERILFDFAADSLLIEMARRRSPLLAYPPPGAEEIVTQYRCENNYGMAHAG